MRAAVEDSLNTGRGCAGMLVSVYAGGGSALPAGVKLCSAPVKPMVGNTLTPPTAACGWFPDWEGRLTV